MFALEAPPLCRPTIESTRVKRLLPLALAALAACSDKPVGPATPIPASLVVSAPQTTLVVGASVQLQATVFDERGKPVSGATVNWQSGSPTVAAVSGGGLVTGVAAGFAVITASSGTRSATVTVEVQPDPCTTPLNLSAGEVRIFSGPAAVRCITLAATTQATDFVFVTSNAEQRPDNLGLYSVIVDFPGALASAVSPAWVQDVDPRVIVERQAVRFADDFEARLRQQERELLARVRPATRGAPVALQLSAAESAAALATVPLEGDTVTYRVPNAGGSALCTDYKTIRAVVRKVSNHAVFAEDVASPAGGFSSADYTSIAAEFESLIYRTDTLYFGRETDRNGDGRVTVLYTPEVNRLSPQGSVGFVAGFFWGGDLVTKAEYQRLNMTCPATNEQEIFYLLVPDPTGTVNGNVRSADAVRQNTRGTIAHEFQHMINQGIRLLSPAVDSAETPWLNEALSHLAEELVGRVQRGFGDLQELSYNDVNPTPSAADDYNAWFRQNFVRHRLWMQRPDTASPISAKAASQLAPRGAGWMLLRYVADHYSGGNVKAFLRNVVAGPDIGVRNLLRHVGGAQWDDILSGFLLSQYTDNLPINALPVRYTVRSWNVRDIMARSNSQAPNVFPLLVTPLPTTVTTQSLSGSGNYYRLIRPVAAGEATFRMSTSGGAAVSFDGARVYVVRVN